MSRFDLDIDRAVRKACSLEETAPKRKHVRACIVYTWDHKSSRAIFNVLKTQPLGEDEIQLFKALITIHKILQEGHPSAIVEGIKNREWIASLGRIYSVGSNDGYGRIIEEYVQLLLKKLNFHRSHKGFNGTFEYEEYMSLVSTSNPDEGYETILDLMDLQDALDAFGRILFASISSGRRNECKISALVPLVSESYGIYKFITSMIRAMHKQTGEDGALEPLHDRYSRQHGRLFEFYADCSAIKYLTSLIRIPKLPTEAPPLDDGSGSSREVSRPSTRNSIKASSPAAPTGVSRAQTSYTGGSSFNNSSSFPVTAQPTGGFIASNTGLYGSFLPVNQSSASLEAERALELQRQQQQLVEIQAQQQEQQQREMMIAEQERQRQLLLKQQQQQLEVERQQQLIQQQQEQAMFEEQMRAQQTQNQLVAQQTQNQLVAQQTQYQTDINALREQHERDQMMLAQYDGRVSALERELENMNLNVKEQLENREEQARGMEQWKEKYEGLARLYAQLRQEHLAVLKKLKRSQQVEQSAKESIARVQVLERELAEKDRAAASLVGGVKEGQQDDVSLEVHKVIEIVLIAASKAVITKTPAPESATNLANCFNNFIADGASGDFASLATSIAEFTVAMAGSKEAQGFLCSLKDLSGTEEEMTDKVIDLNVHLQRLFVNQTLT